ncbi:MAG: UDP-3-O-acyl-N-acetylglucosamine deacetylase [Rickettsiales bacterium]|jgi:UDP-3-O-[3-hydroxymyristoyl] N-acetylglucosamine deacetylase|nr:UDP-3-O-acyl-N-acetylglucosamine deacetylase [Rickettsiales bacterium]
MKEKTIKNSIEISGVGLHSGKVVFLRLSPSDSGGIVFKNDKNQTIRPLFSNVTDLALGTTISNGLITVKTIEHLMAGIYACDIDNITIGIQGEEIPILDGSAKIFIDEIEEIGIKTLDSDKKYLKILKDVEIVEDDKYAKISPSDDFSIDMTVDFMYGNIHKQHLYWNGQRETFFARTFCNQKEIDYMWSIGLARGGNLDNAMVFDENGIINEGGFRMNNEVVNHKTLDCIGDLFTSGYYIKGKVIANKTGHATNNKLLKKIFEDKNNYIII